MNQEERKKALDALYYEIWMFNESLALSNYIQIHALKCTAMKNVILESFLLHARNLIDFLENNRIRSDDLTCVDFNNRNQQQIDPISPRLQPNIKQKINKHLSHLTKTRVNEKPEWNLEKIRSSINQALINFFDQISESYFPTKGDRDKEDFLKILQQESDSVSDENQGITNTSSDVT